MPDNITFMDWTAAIAVGDGTVEKPISEITTLPTGSLFSLSGTVSASGYLYAVELGESEVAVLHPADDTPDPEAAGTRLRLPTDKPQFTAPLDGELRVFSSPQLLTESDWIALFPGRDPPIRRSRGRDSVPKAPARPKETP